ncbi:MAG TPA: hypothetical protein VFA22_01290 [Stellaceae bacterium]|nr:hypothetical protein [Stellaceae bacterium]
MDNTVALEPLTGWKARRSGGRITITGRDETGVEVKVPNVDTIEVRNGQVIAVDKDGDAWLLKV